MSMLAIHSDGTPHGTVLVTEAGDKITNVTSATIRLEAGEFVLVDVELMGTVVNVNATVNNIVFRCPTCDLTIDHDCKR